MLPKVHRRTIHGAYTLFCVLTALFAMYSIVNPKWYGAEATTGGTYYGIANSPWYSCTRASSEIWSCSEVNLNGDLAAIGDCDVRTTATLKNNVYAIRAMIIITGLFAALGAVCSSVFSGFGPSFATIGSIVLAVCAGISFIFNIIGIAISVVFFKTTLYCSDGYCNLIRAMTGNPSDLDCKESFYHGALVYLIGVLLPFAALVVAVLLVVTAPTMASLSAHAHRGNVYSVNDNKEVSQFNEPTEMLQSRSLATGADGQDNVASGNNNYTNTTAANAAPTSTAANGAAPAGGDVTFQPPEGDWEWDPNSNMYWSESQYLFLNPNDGHFFDPNSEQWYNPDTEQWYA